MKKILVVLLLIAALVFVAACRREEDPDPVGEVTPTPAPAAEVTPTPTPAPVDVVEEPTDVLDVEFEEDPRFGTHPNLDHLDLLLQFFPTDVGTPGDAILQPGAEGNILRLVQPGANPFPGLHADGLSSEANDSAIQGFQTSPFVWTNAGFRFVDGGIANLYFDLENNALQLDMNETVFWHDGVELTLDDLVFAYELAARNNYHGGVGIRFTATHFFPWVIGMEEFRTGQADYISGMVLSNNNRTLRIYYDRPLPPSAAFAGGIWLTPSPRHHLTPAIEELHSPGTQDGWGRLHEHPRARHEVLGFGPWIIEEIVPGNMEVIFRANDNYHRGRPNIDYIHWSIRPLELWLEEMVEGLWDIGGGLPAVRFLEFMGMRGTEDNPEPPNNLILAGGPATGTGFLYFRTGIFDSELGEVVPRPEGWHPIQNLAIRQALAHAMPQHMIAREVQNNLAVPAGTILHPHNARSFIYQDVPQFFQGVDVANAILDAAGFTERGPDGFRLDLDGNPMYFVFAANDNDFNRVAVPIYFDYWAQIGLDVRMFQDDLITWGTFVDNILMSDNWSDYVHLFISNWSLGANPAPHSLWGHDAPFNMARWMTPEMRGIMDDIIAFPYAFDGEFLREAYRRWQVYAYENAISVQNFWSIALTPVNERITGWTTERVPGLIGNSRSHLWGLTQPTIPAATN